MKYINKAIEKMSVIVPSWFNKVRELVVVSAHIRPLRTGQRLCVRSCHPGELFDSFHTLPKFNGDNGVPRFSSKYTGHSPTIGFADKYLL